MIKYNKNFNNLYNKNNKICNNIFNWRMKVKLINNLFSNNNYKIKNKFYNIKNQLINLKNSNRINKIFNKNKINI